MDKLETVARAIAQNGFGRDWDDFLPINARDTDQGDLMEYAAAAIAALEPVTVQEAAKALLESYDAFMAGGPEGEHTRAVSTAACFGAAAYEKGVGGQGVHALARAFLIALIDPADWQLDYLRADPKAGETAREAVESLRALAERGE